VWVKNKVHGSLPVFMSYRRVNNTLIDAVAAVACTMLGLRGEPYAMPFSTTLIKQKSFVVGHCHGNEASLYNCSAVIER
jgi:hypothetical protein